MSVCTSKLSKNFVRDCIYKPKAGLHEVAYLINLDDIDKASSQLGATGMNISSIVMKMQSDGTTPRTIFKAEGAGKYPQGTSELVKGDNGSMWVHGLNARIVYYGVDQREELQAMVENGRFVAIVKKRDGGLADEIRYEVLGWESGMAVQAVNWNSNENNGVVSVELKTEEGEEEGTDRKVFMDTDIDTTETWLSDNLYTAP
jgi:hypothetical protein